MMKYIYVILTILVVVFLAYYLIPLAFYLMRILIGLAVLAVFGLGFWTRGLLEKKSDKEVQ